MRSWLRSNRGFLLFLACFALFRTAVADWNPVPSGSMRPTVLEGDVLLVNRLAYDLKVPLTDVGIASLGEPKRGDIVTFESPRDGMRLVKRIVGLPGDTIAMRKNVLYVNGIAARYSDPALVRTVDRQQHPLRQVGRRDARQPVQVEEPVLGRRRDRPREEHHRVLAERA